MGKQSEIRRCVERLERNTALSSFQKDLKRLWIPNNDKPLKGFAQHISLQKAKNKQHDLEDSPAWKILSSGFKVDVLKKSPAERIVWLQDKFFQYGRANAWSWIPTTTGQCSGLLDHRKMKQGVCQDFSTAFALLVAGALDLALDKQGFIPLVSTKSFVGNGSGTSEYYYLTPPGTEVIDKAWDSEGQVSTDKKSASELKSYCFTEHWFLSYKNEYFDPTTNSRFKKAQDIVWGIFKRRHPHEHVYERISSPKFCTCGAACNWTYLIRESGGEHNGFSRWRLTNELGFWTIFDEVSEELLDLHALF